MWIEGKSEIRNKNQMPQIGMFKTAKPVGLGIAPSTDFDQVMKLKVELVLPKQFGT
jgi:hypothetical protein